MNLQNIVTWGVELLSRNTVFAHIPLRANSAYGAVNFTAQFTDNL